MKPKPGDLLVGRGYRDDRRWIVVSVCGDDIDMRMFGKGVSGVKWMLSYRTIQLELAAGQMHHVRPE